MDKVLGGLFGFAGTKFRSDDNSVDRMTRRNAVIMLVIFCLVVTTSTYVGDRINCWCPDHFLDTHKSYANTICWVKSTYYIPMDEYMGLPSDATPIISYYQWVPMILLCQAILCYLPSVIWQILYRRSGINIANVVETAKAGQGKKGDAKREKANDCVVYMLDRYLTELSRDTSSIDEKEDCACAKQGGIFSPRSRLCPGTYLVICYIFTKILYVINAIGQLYLLDLFLSFGFHGYGLEVLSRLFSHPADWTFSERFPRVTICDFEVRRQSQLHHYVIQCVIPINLFNEKIFILVWFMFAIMSALTIANFIRCIYRNVYSWNSMTSYIQRLLKTHDKSLGKRAYVESIRNPNQAAIERFVRNYLRRDGIFLLNIISDNAGRLASSEIAIGLFRNLQSLHTPVLTAGDLTGDDDLPKKPRLENSAVV